MAYLNGNRNQDTKLHRLMGILNRLLVQIRDIFSLEEVEVTFTKVGDSTRYSYTKTRHKQIARG